MNIIECVKKYSGVSFDKQPFGEVDSLILSELAYQDFSVISDKNFGFEICLKDLFDKAELMSRNAVHSREGLKLFRAIGESNRYSSLKVGYYREKNDDKLPMRFAAVSFLLDDNKIYVAFRGTDVTILGWQEDFDLLFQNTIPSQKEALQYLMDIMQVKNNGIIIGGHSKGGNLAVYSSMNVPKNLQDGIVAIYNHDGPGFHKNIFDKPEYLQIKSRIHKTVPHDSLVGMLLEHSDTYKIVKSRKTLLGQHNPFEWEIKDLTSFVTLPKTASISRRASDVLNLWLGGLSDKQRKQFVTALFRIISASGKKLAKELSHLSIGQIIRMRRVYKALPTEEHELIKTGGRILVRIWLRVIRNLPAEKQKRK